MMQGPLTHEPDSASWVRQFLALPVEHTPGTFYCYNSMCTFMLSAIVQKVTGQTVLDLLDARLFGPMKIDRPVWETSPEGISTDGALGQFIIILPEKNAVAVITSFSADTGSLLDTFWSTLWPVI